MMNEIRRVQVNRNQPQPAPAPVKMCSGYGQYHTNEPDPDKPHKKLAPYAQTTLEQIREMVRNPPSVEKEEAQWVIPSTLPSRVFEVQRKQGEFHFLWVDLDKTPPTADQLAGVLSAIVPGSEYLTYSSRSARADYQKARIIIPLARPISGDDFELYQDILNDYFQAHGIIPDRVSERAGQLCYLPNRGDFYTHSIVPGSPFDPLTAWADKIREKREAMAREEEEVRRRVEAARAARAAREFSGEASVIDAFCQAYAPDEILLRNGYAQRGTHFRHPGSDSGSYSASVKAGKDGKLRIKSLSHNDPLYIDGPGGHDAFSACCILEHGGDQKAATKAAARELDMAHEEGGPEIHWHGAGEPHHDDGRTISHHGSKNASGRDSERSGGAPGGGKGPIFDTPQPISDVEWYAARLTPDCIVRELIYADVGMVNAQGGTGKTTLMLFEAIHIALGLPVYGLDVHKPGPVVFVTAEDSREMLVARLREICKAMALTTDQLAIVRRDVRISDVSGRGLKLTMVSDDVVLPSGNVSALVDALRGLAPVVIYFDPAVSFGTGESRVNDGPQGLVEAARKVRNELNCATPFIHHTGQEAARNKSSDQYSGRGGSAFPDGSRMVRVLNTLDASEWRKATGTDLEEGESGIEMSRPKLSFCRANLPPIYLRRKGYLFSVANAETRQQSAEAERAAIDNQVFQLIASECDAGRFPTKTWCESGANGLTQKSVREAIVRLLHVSRIEEAGRPERGRGYNKYLRPITRREQGHRATSNSPGGGESTHSSSAQNPPDYSSLPIDKKATTSNPSLVLPSDLLLVETNLTRGNEENEESAITPPDDGQPPPVAHGMERI